MPTAFLKSLLVASLFVVFSTELLGMFKLLNCTSVYVFWALAFAISIGLFYQSGFNIKQIKSRFQFQNQTGIHWLLLSLIGLILVVTFVTAVFSAPNNWDSMVYHLARIPNWIQQQSVNHFATHITRQIAFPPLSEYMMMHTMLLSKGDAWVNLVQWLAMLGSLVGVYQISRSLNLGRTAALIAVAFVASLPMGILQSSSTQNDYVTAFFLLTTAYFVIQYHQHKKPTNIIWIALSAGLALLTKGTAYIYLFPFAVWFVVLLVKRINGSSAKFATIGLIILIAINVNHWNRNYQIFENPLGDETNTMQYFAPKALASNLIRNSAMELTSQSELLNSVLSKITYHTHQLIGIDQNDERTTWAGTQPFEIRKYLSHEDYASNPIHFALFLLASFFLLIFLKKEKRLIGIYAAAVLAIYLLFCFLLEWQIWHNRLHLPILIASAPVIAYVLSKWKKLSYGLAIIMILLGIYISLNNETRPIIGKQSIFKTERQDQYFIKRPEQKAHWQAIKDYCTKNKINSIGFIDYNSGWEYPLWQIVNSDYAMEIKNIKVENESKRLEDQAYKPNIILVQKRLNDNSLQQAGNTYTKTKTFGDLSIYKLN